MTVAGRVPSMEPESYVRADLVAVPLRYGSGTPVKILEAFANRIPVVSTTIGAEGLHVEPGRELLVADDPQGFAEACVRLLQDTELRASLAESAHQVFLDRHQWGVAQTRIRDLFLETSGVESVAPRPAPFGRRRCKRIAWVSSLSGVPGQARLSSRDLLVRSRVSGCLLRHTSSLILRGTSAFAGSSRSRCPSCATRSSASSPSKTRRDSRSTFLHWPQSSVASATASSSSSRPSSGISPAGHAYSGEKTPGHLWWWPAIADAAPHVKFVLTVRDPRSVVASILSMPWAKEGELAQWGDRAHLSLATRWAFDQEVAAAMIDALGPARCVVLRYEDVVARPETARHGIARLIRLGEDVSFQKAPDDLVLPWESWKLRALDEVTTDRVTTWREDLGTARADEVAAICRAGMVRFGYSLRQPDAKTAALRRFRLGKKVRDKLDEELDHYRIYESKIKQINL